jgi:protein Tex
MNDKHLKLIAQSTNIAEKNILNTIKLIDEGGTIPFIARYRKEVTGSLDEVEVGAIKDQYQKLLELEKRRTAILSAINEQGKLTPELQKKIENVWTITELEDLYLPYKQKKKTRATIAKEKGLEPLAEILFKQNKINIEQVCSNYINDVVPTIEDALQGARDIMAEWFSEDIEVRNRIRMHFERNAIIKSKLVKGKDTEGIKFKDYFQWEEPLNKCPSHRMLAMRRGEDEGFLRLIISPDDDAVKSDLTQKYIINDNDAADQVHMALQDGYDRLIAPSIETEFRNISKDKSDLDAIAVFAENLKQLLLSAPLGQKAVLGLDPGFRTGCKIVCLDQSGKLLYNTNIYPHPPQSQMNDAKELIKNLVYQYQIEAIAIGDGTAGRESETMIRAIKFDKNIEIFMVNENGASIYSASDTAREEFPELDITVRGAISIGRRLMDPLAELVKIDAKSIGVGQYQYDVNQNQLKESLDRVVESCVNSVGVNLNTASKHLLTYVSGLGPTLAQNIIKYRQEHGMFRKREELLKVARVGDKAYEQAAGFLRIANSENPMDNTAVHPESYSLVTKMAKDLGVTLDAFIGNRELRKQIVIGNYVTEKIGLPTLQDIMKELDKPGLDPRGAAKSFSFADIHSFDEVYTGMIIPGLITNVTNFGAFVNIGVKQDGLIHISHLSNKYIKSPQEVVKLNQEVLVKVIEVDKERKRIMLSLKEV